MLRAGRKPPGGARALRFHGCFVRVRAGALPTHACGATPALLTAAHHIPANTYDGLMRMLVAGLGSAKPDACTLDALKLPQCVVSHKCSTALRPPGATNCRCGPRWWRGGAPAGLTRLVAVKRAPVATSPGVATALLCTFASAPGAALPTRRALHIGVRPSRSATVPTRA